VLQPTGRRSSDEDGVVVEEEDGRRHLDEEEDGWRRPDAVPGENSGVGLRPPPAGGLPNGGENWAGSDSHVDCQPGQKAGKRPGSPKAGRHTSSRANPATA